MSISEIKTVTGNEIFDNLMAKTYSKLKADLQMEIIDDQNPLEVVKREQDEIVKSIHDPELFFKKYSVRLSTKETPELSQFLHITSYIEEGLENDILTEFKQQLKIVAYAKALLFYFHYVDHAREALEANPHPSDINTLINAPVPTVEAASETFNIIQQYREAFRDLLIVGLKKSSVMNLNKEALYKRELFEFSRLSAADQDSNPFTYLRERLKTEDPHLDINMLYSTCQEIARTGYGGIIMSFRARRYKYLATALAIDDYLRHLHSLTKTSSIVDDEPEEVALIKLTKKYSYVKKLKDLYKQLSDKGYLQCNEQDFLGLFGKQDGEYSPKPMIWKSSQSSLFYFLFTLLKKCTEMDTIKIFVRIADEWFVKVEEGKKISFSNAINYHSALDKFIKDRIGNYTSSKSYLPSKHNVETLDIILKTAMPS